MNLAQAPIGDDEIRVTITVETGTSMALTRSEVRSATVEAYIVPAWRRATTSLLADIEYDLNRLYPEENSK